MFETLRRPVTCAIPAAPPGAFCGFQIDCVLIASDVLDVWMHTARVQTAEVCGPIAGSVLQDGTLVVTHTGGPGSDGLRAHSLSDYDHSVVQGWTDSIQSLWPCAILCGVIHLHPSGSHYSSIDERVMREWVLDPVYNLEQAFFPIIGRDATGEPSELTVWHISRTDLTPRIIPWERLEFGNPLLREVRYGQLPPSRDYAWSETPQSEAPQESMGSSSHDDSEAVLRELAWGLAAYGLSLNQERPVNGLDLWTVRDGKRVLFTCLRNIDGSLYVFRRHGISSSSRVDLQTSTVQSLADELARLALGRRRPERGRRDSESPSTIFRPRGFGISTGPREPRSGHSGIHWR